jgi:hypothetical protein
MKKNNTTVIPRIDQWINLMKNSSEECKIGTFVDMSFQLNDNMFEPSDKTSKTFDVIFTGEIDYIDLTNHTLVDIKCSTNDFKLEWLLQLLMYYSILSKADRKYVIKKIAIANIFRGIYYTFDIPGNYNVNGMIGFAKHLVKDSLNGKRKKLNICTNDLCMMMQSDTTTNGQTVNGQIDVSEVDEFIDEVDHEQDQNQNQIIRHNVFNMQKYLKPQVIVSKIVDSNIQI